MFSSTKNAIFLFQIRMLVTKLVSLLMIRRYYYYYCCAQVAFGSGEGEREGCAKFGLG